MHGGVGGLRAWQRLTAVDSGYSRLTLTVCRHADDSAQPRRGGPDPLDQNLTTKHPSRVLFSGCFLAGGKAFSVGGGRIVATAVRPRCDSDPVPRLGAPPRRPAPLQFPQSLVVPRITSHAFQPLTRAPRARPFALEAPSCPLRFTILPTLPLTPYPPPQPSLSRPDTFGA